MGQQSVDLVNCLGVFVQDKLRQSQTNKMQNNGIEKGRVLFLHGYSTEYCNLTLSLSLSCCLTEAAVAGDVQYRPHGPHTDPHKTHRQARG